MTPREVDQLTDAEWDAFTDFMRDEARAVRQAARKRSR
jgi:hypothetical protein